jgi:hypothetical protein
MTISYTPPPAGRKLIVGQIFGETFAVCWKLKGKLPRAALWPFLVALVALALTPIDLLLDTPEPYASLNIMSELVEIPYNLLMAAAYTLFAVAWHRFVLLETHWESSAPTAWRRRHTVFFGYQLLVYLIVVVVLLPMLVVIGAMGLYPGRDPSTFSASLFLLLFIVVVTAVFIFWYVFFRLSFVFPARAVGERYTLRDSWRHTRGNGWRLIAIAFLVNVALSIVLLPLVLLSTGLITSLLFANPQSSTASLVIASVVLGAVYVIAEFIGLALNVTLISLSFRTATGWVPGPPLGLASPPTLSGETGEA